jgi:hypothetical protein
MGPFNFGSMGTENLPAGNGPAIPYGSTPSGMGGPMVNTASMQGPMSSATSNIGYRPTSGRADRLNSNIVGSSDFNNMASGGYSGGATSRM